MAWCEVNHRRRIRKAALLDVVEVKKERVQAHYARWGGEWEKSDKPVWVPEGRYVKVSELEDGGICLAAALPFGVPSQKHLYWYVD